MPWTCPRCGLVQDAWSIRCQDDGAWRFPPTTAPVTPAEAAAREQPRAVRRDDEVELFGQATGDVPEQRRRSRLRPARLAGVASAIWLATPFIWAFFQPPSIASQVGLLLLMIAVPGALAYGIALLASPRTPRPAALAGATFVPITQFIVDCFPREGRLQIGMFTLDRAILGAVQVEMPGPRGGWPPAATPDSLRVVGRWIAAPERFEARVIETVDEQQRPIRPTIRADEPRGWGLASVMLVTAGFLTAAWLSA